MRRGAVLAYLVRRLLLYAFTIWGAFTIAFIFFHMVPGDPMASYVRSLQQRGRQVPDAEQLIASYRKMMGLDGSLLTQYGHYLYNVVIRFNLGPSFIGFPTPAVKYIELALPWTIGLLGLSTIIAWILGFVLGGIVGWRRDSVGSRFITSLALIISQIPPYFIALALLFLFAYTLMWLPRRGAFDASIHKAFTWEFIKSVIRYGTMPALSLVLFSMFGWVISTRSMVVSILGEDYLVYAKSKGLPPGKVLRSYVLRNAMLPQATGLALSLGFILNGAYLVEILFNYPGMGLLFRDVISLLDYNTIQAITLISITAVVTATLLIDLFLPLIDPRVAREAKA